MKMNYLYANQLSLFIYLLFLCISDYWYRPFVLMHIFVLDEWLIYMLMLSVIYSVGKCYTFSINTAVVIIWGYTKINILRHLRWYQQKKNYCSSSLLYLLIPISFHYHKNDNAALIYQPVWECEIIFLCQKYWIVCCLKDIFRQ